MLVEEGYSMEFKIGDKVECINAHVLMLNPPLIEGAVYTVVGFNTDSDLKLEGVEYSWDKNRFKPYVDQTLRALQAQAAQSRQVPYGTQGINGVVVGHKADSTSVLTESQKRKAKPIFSGCMMYFPDAILAVSELSKKGNDKHNPGERLHWARGKSTDQADCIARHLIDIGPNWDNIDPEFGSLHATALAWRALALLQTVLEKANKQSENPTSKQGDK